MPIAQGMVKQTRFKKQSAKGTISGTSGGQILRRTSSVFELAKETYDTAEEIVSHRQLASVRHGVRTVNGSVDGILSASTYTPFIESVLARTFAAVTATTSVGLTIAGSGPTYTLTRAAGSWLTDGYKNGMVIRLSVGTLNAANINKNLLIVNISSATVCTVMPVNGVALVAEGPITGCTVTATGKVSFAANASHTNDYYTFEEWHSDVPSSAVFQDVKIGGFSLSLPGSGNATISVNAIGLDQPTLGSTVYFSAPTAETTTDSLVGASGILVVNGSAIATVTDLSIDVTNNAAGADAVLGSNVLPDVFTGLIQVSGSFTAYFDSTTIPNLFFSETETSILGVLADGTSATAGFISYALPRITLTSDTPEDGQTGLKRTYNFTAEYNSVGGSGVATEKTTIMIQDSAY
jgi:hypothetical protein